MCLSVAYALRLLWSHPLVWPSLIWYRLDQWFSTWGPQSHKWSANDFKGGTRAWVRKGYAVPVFINYYSCVLENNLLVNDIRIDLF